jgi:putative flippase GtrA
VVGGVGFLVDTGVFALLRSTVLSASVVASGPLIAKVLSTTVAIYANWLGNRYWTFRDRRRTDTGREALEFLIVSVGGLLISLACLGVSHYLLGLRTTIDDTISANGVGLVLGTAFRYVFYSTWVYRDRRVS